LINGKIADGILLVAGNSTRFNGNCNKTFEKINNIPIFMYSLNVFSQNKYIDNIIIVVKSGEESIVNDFLAQTKSTKNIIIIIGGDTRQKSVYNALRASNSDLVVIQDGARPMLKDEYINNSLIELENYTGTSIAVKSKDTIKIADSEGIVLETTQRQNTWITQTPQCFNRQVLLDIHSAQKDSSLATDDCMLLENAEYKIKLIEGDYTNIKITTPEDLDIAQKFLPV
jgi:2-C-methyl-D-erythritol 4-phosphate cytidylyltransferase